VLQNAAIPVARLLHGWKTWVCLQKMGIGMPLSRKNQRGFFDGEFNILRQPKKSPRRSDLEP